jgi:hypothetical protein
MEINQESKNVWTIGDVVIWIIIILVIWGGWSMASIIYANLTSKWTVVAYSKILPIKESEILRSENIDSKEKCIATGKNFLLYNQDIKTWRCFKLPTDKYNLDKDTLEYCYPEGCINSK